MRVKSTEQLVRQIRILKTEKILLEKRNKELLKDNRLLAAKNQFLESKNDELTERVNDL